MKKFALFVSLSLVSLSGFAHADTHHSHHTRYWNSCRIDNIEFFNFGKSMGAVNIQRDDSVKFGLFKEGAQVGTGKCEWKENLVENFSCTAADGSKKLDTRIMDSGNIIVLQQHEKNGTISGSC